MIRCSFFCLSYSITTVIVCHFFYHLEIANFLGYWIKYTHWVGNAAFKTPTRPLNCWFSNCAIRLVRLSTLEIKNNTWVHCTVLYNWKKSAINIWFVTQSHQTTNFVFPNFFQGIFSAWADFFLVLYLWKVFLFHLVKLEKIWGKNGEN